MALGEFALVRQHLEDALAGPDVSPSYIDPAADHDLYAMLVDAAAQQQDLDALKKYAPLAEESATRSDHTLYQAIAHRAWGVAHRLANEHVAAEARLQQALTLFRKLDARWQIGRTRHELGTLAVARGRTTAAGSYYAHALAGFEDLGATPDAARTLAVLNKLS